MYRLLIVEDEQQLIHLMINIFKRLNYEVFACTTGQEALQLIEREEIDLMITDIFLKDLNGQELIEIIRSNPYYKNIKVIFTSGMAFELSDFKLKPDAFLAKPFSLAELLATVKQTLSVEAIAL